MKTIKILEQYTPCGIDVGRIVNRILMYAPKWSLEGLETIVVVDNDPSVMAFGCYRKQSRRIELYVYHIIGDLPWLLRKSYIIPYLFIALALGHEIDHHVNREVSPMEKEALAESNAMKYVYPSFGVFKPLYRLFAMILKLFRSSSTSSALFL